MQKSYLQKSIEKRSFTLLFLFKLLLKYCSQNSYFYTKRVEKGGFTLLFLFVNSFWQKTLPWVHYFSIISTDLKSSVKSVFYSHVHWVWIMYFLNLKMQIRKKLLNILNIFYQTFINLLLVNPIKLLKSLYPTGQASHIHCSKDRAGQR